VAAEAAAQDQGSVWAAACRAAAEARACQADPEAAAAPVVGEAAELTPVVCGVRQGRVGVAAELGLVVEVVRAGEGAPAAELGSVVAAAVWAVVAAQADRDAGAVAPAVPVVEVVQGAGHLEAPLVRSALPERRERRPANG